MGRRIKLNQTQLIGEGLYGRVYGIGEFAIKVYGFKGSACDHESPHEIKIRTYHDESVARELYRASISVPKSFGVFRVEVGGKKGVGFVMERIKGKHVQESNKEAYAEMESEVKKARKLGLCL